MKKILLLFLSVFCLGACSVDEIEIEPIEQQLLVLDATYQVDGCNVTTFNFGQEGKIEVRNDRHFVYVKILAMGESQLVQSNLHIAENLSGFPTTGNGGIAINKMDNQNSFSPVKEYSYSFPIKSFGDSFLVGAYSVFQLGKKQTKLWTGDQSGRQWLYFEYFLNEHPYNAGSNKTKEISLSEAVALPSWDEVRKLYSNMLDPGIIAKTGTFNPTIWELIHMFNDPNRESMEGEYPTTFTLGTGECKDSVTLTLIVVPDEI